jgi:hypothetical protein
MRALGAWVVTKDDIKAAFDRVNTDAVLKDFGRVISDPKYQALIGAVLRGSAGDRRREGIDQGNSMSPLGLNVHLDRVHDALIGDVGTLASWFRYADDLAYLTRKVSEGQRARERSADLLKQVGLTLKGPGEPIDLREGRSVRLLGLLLRLHKGVIRYEIPDEAYTELETKLEEAHEEEDPPETARNAAFGWTNFYGPAFENSADDVVERVLDLADSHGFRGVLRREDIQTRGRSAHQSWLALRGRFLREAGLMMPSIGPRKLLSAAAPPAASDGRCLSRPMPGRGEIVLPARLFFAPIPTVQSRGQFRGHCPLFEIPRHADEH